MANCRRNHYNSVKSLDYSFTGGLDSVIASQNKCSKTLDRLGVQSTGLLAVDDPEVQSTGLLAVDIDRMSYVYSNQSNVCDLSLGVTLTQCRGKTH